MVIDFAVPYDTTAKEHHLPVFFSSLAIGFIRAGDFERGIEWLVKLSKDGYKVNPALCAEIMDAAATAGRLDVADAMLKVCESILVLPKVGLTAHGSCQCSVMSTTMYDTISSAAVQWQLHCCTVAWQRSVYVAPTRLLAIQQLHNVCLLVGVLLFSVILMVCTFLQGSETPIPYRHSEGQLINLIHAVFKTPQQRDLADRAFAALKRSLAQMPSTPATPDTSDSQRQQQAVDTPQPAAPQQLWPQPQTYHAMIAIHAAAGNYATAFQYMAELERAWRSRRPLSVSVYGGVSFFVKALDTEDKLTSILAAWTQQPVSADSHCICPACRACLLPDAVLPLACQLHPCCCLVALFVLSSIVSDEWPFTCMMQGIPTCMLQRTMLLCSNATMH